LTDRTAEIFPFGLEGKKEMLMKKLLPVLTLLACASFAMAQDATSQPATAQPSPDSQQQQEEKAKLEKKAISLLEQVVSESQALKLPENKIRVNIVAGDLLWDKNAARARGLFNDAGTMISQVAIELDRTDRDEIQTFNQLRQELVLSAGRHDGELAYQLMRSTQQPQSTNLIVGRGNRGLMFDQTDNLEQRLLAVIATNDPKFAYQKAMESLDKGEFPNGIGNILTQLQTKDEEAYKKLADKTMSRLASDSLLANRQATSLAIALLFPGPRPSGNATATPATTNAPPTTNATQTMTMNSRQAPVLNEAAYHDLMDNAVNAALSVTSMGPIGNTQRGGGPQRVMRGPQAQPQQTQPDETQVRQNNARTLLFSLQTMLPQIDQYLPERSAAVRQKLTDLGMNNNQMANMGNQMRAMQQASSDALLTAASTAPQPIQARMYQQAAQRAVEEGNTDRAIDIATNHLDENGRAVIMQAVDFKKLTTTASPEKMNEIKQKLAALPSDSDRIKYLIDLANATQKDNPKLALRFLEDARGLVSKRAMNYRDFEDQLKVADAYGAVDPKRSFEIIDAGIAEINELLNAATVLNGFEVEIFRDGELSSRSDSDLVRMVARFGSQIAALAKVDFDGARATADKFQMPEARMTARLSIVQNALGAQPVNVNNRNQNFQFFMR
jgi:hypothetical protein